MKEGWAEGWSEATARAIILTAPFLASLAPPLLIAGYDVHVVVDGVSSMSPLDRDIALKRMEKSGAYMTTAQSAAFMLMQSANHPNFKTVSKMISGHAKNTNGFHELARRQSSL